MKTWTEYSLQCGSWIQILHFNHHDKIPVSGDRVYWYQRIRRIIRYAKYLSIFLRNFISREEVNPLKYIFYPSFINCLSPSYEFGPLPWIHPRNLYPFLMPNNVFLFTGEEKYLLNQEISRRKSNFAEKFWSNGIFSFNSENFDLGQLKESIFGWGLFASKKLIIIHGIPTDSDTSNKISAETSEKLTEEIIAKEGQILADNIVVFVSYKPDKRGRFYKFLEQNTKVKTFEKLSGIELKNFVKNELNWPTIDYSTIDYFLIKVGNDLYNIVNECKKLQTRCKAHKESTISAPMIDLINFWQTETKSFAFFDNFFEHQDKKLQIIDDMQQEATNRNQVIGTLYRWVKVYLYIADLDNQWIRDSKTIASMTRLHPFVISKSLKNIAKIKEKEAEIKALYRSLITLDHDIKSGKLPDSYFRLWIKKMVCKI